MASFGNGPLFNDGLSGALFNPADEVLFFCLPLIKVPVALVIAVHDSGLSWCQNLCHKGTLIGFAGTEVNSLRNAPVDIKAKMDFRFLGTVPVVGKLHRLDRINKRAV